MLKLLASIAVIASAIAHSSYADDGNTSQNTELSPQYKQYLLNQELELINKRLHESSNNDSSCEERMKKYAHNPNQAQAIC